ncbi:hypothetical protein LC087_19390 (plasmid) [Bacillus carboniphilus]|uniref:Uncharacterized protein n=1 Tax=Bacillus carboniphilus TaxID=86663 RepID=A0ABY9JYK5_9BACI|nr:hypothetical protein [Bacillus carboniphilus]WLR44467.1 hypothetical protein LC087_19390 [Bacillus carboniphilus]
MDIEKKKKYTDRSFLAVLIILLFVSFFWRFEENQDLVLISKYTFILFWVIYSLRLFVLEMFNEVKRNGLLIINGLIFLAGAGFLIHTLFFQ